MGELVERVKLNLLVNGDGVVDNFKNNSLFFLEKWSKSDESVKNIRPGDALTFLFDFLDILNRVGHSYSTFKFVSFFSQSS